MHPTSVFLLFGMHLFREIREHFNQRKVSYHSDLIEHLEHSFTFATCREGMYLKKGA